MKTPETLIETIVIATYHNTRRNDKRCAHYWHICNYEKEDEIIDSDAPNYIYCHWFKSGLPKRILNELMKAPDSNNNYSLKQGFFKIKLKAPQEFDFFGHVEFSNVHSIEYIE